MFYQFGIPRCFKRKTIQVFLFITAVFYANMVDIRTKIMAISKNIAYIKYKMGMMLTLPASSINKVNISENNEPLVNIKNADVKLFFGDRLKNEKQVLLRKSVADMLFKAAKSLPQGKYLIVYDAYRPLQKQMEIWNKKFKFFKDKYPEESEEQITKRTKAVVADPRIGYGGHQTGGATDVGLCDENGQELNMGTAYSASEAAIRTNHPVNPFAEANRKLLLRTMQKQGFVNYPNEWWHFCYGDKMWAAYKNKNNCLYGIANEDFVK